VRGVYLGADPGASGALAVIDGDGLFVACMRLNETPADVWAWLESYTAGVRHAVLERVSAMPRQGVASTFKFGVSYGLVQGFLVAADIPFEKVTPGVWQRKLGCLSGGDKNVTKRRAQELFPAAHVTHHVADAYLLAEYARRVVAERAAS